MWNEIHEFRSRYNFLQKAGKKSLERTWDLRHCQTHPSRRVPTAGGVSRREWEWLEPHATKRPLKIKNALFRSRYNFLQKAGKKSLERTWDFWRRQTHPSRRVPTLGGVSRREWELLKPHATKGPWKIKYSLSRSRYNFLQEAGKKSLERTAYLWKC